MFLYVCDANGTQIPNIKTVTFHESVNAEYDLRPGAVCSAWIEVVAFGTYDDAPKRGDAVSLYRLDGETPVLLGLFYAEPAITTKDTYSFKAYDAAANLDADYSGRLNEIQNSFPMTVYALVSDACNVAGVTLGSSSWPLSTQTVKAFYADNITCRQIVQWAAEIAGKFVQCNTSGNLIFKWYESATESIGQSADNNVLAYRQDGLRYENYSVQRVGSVAVRPLDTEGAAYIYPASVAEVYATESGGNVVLYNLSASDTNGDVTLSDAIDVYADGGDVDIEAQSDNTNAYIVGGNLLLTNADSTTMNLVAQTIYNALRGLPVWRPSSCSLFPWECTFRAGDIVIVTDSQGVSFTTLVMTFTLSESNAQIESTGYATYTDYQQTTQAALSNLSASIVQINKLKVGWADIQEAIIQYIKLYGSMSVFTDNTLTTVAGQIGFTTGESASNIGQGIVMWSGGRSVFIAGNDILFIGYYSEFDPWVDGGAIKINSVNYPNYIKFVDDVMEGATLELAAGKAITLNGRNVLSEIGTLSSLDTTAKTSLVAALNEVQPIKGVAETGTDLDDITTPGWYQLPGTNSYTNLPSGITWGLLEVKKAGTFTVQELTTTTARTFKRIYANAAWSAWRELSAPTISQNSNNVLSIS